MSNKPILRGIQAVRAEADGGIVSELASELSTAFADFKAKQRDELAKVKDSVTSLQAAVDEAATARAMRGVVGSDAPAKNAIEGLSTGAAVTAYYRARAAHRQEPADVDLGDVFRAVAGMQPRRTSLADVQASLSQGTDSDGGYSVPSQTMPRILSAMVPGSSLLTAGAGIVPLDSGAKSISQAVVSALPTAAWRLELGSITESQPTFRAVTATPKSLACIIRVSRELLADSPDIERSIVEVLGQAFALELDRVGLLGSGTNPEPLGLARTSGVNAVSMGTNGAALADYSPILDGIQAVMEANGPAPTAAIMSPRTLVDFSGLADTLGQPLNKPPLVAPIKFGQTTQIPNNDTAGTNSDASKIYLGDFTRCYFLLREALSLQILREAYAKTGEIAFLAHIRGDFVVPYPKAFAIVSGVRASA